MARQGSGWARGSAPSAISPARSRTKCPACCGTAGCSDLAHPVIIEFVSGERHDMKHIGGAGRPERYPGQDDDPLPAASHLVPQRHALGLADHLLEAGDIASVDRV